MALRSRHRAAHAHPDRARPALRRGVGGAAGAFDVVLNAQGEYLDAHPNDGTEPPRRLVFIDPDPADPTTLKVKPPRGGRHVNGQLCFFPKGFGHDGDFLIADDTYREACLDPKTGPEPQGNFDPQGCAFDKQGRFFGTDAGHGDPQPRSPPSCWPRSSAPGWRHGRGIVAARRRLREAGARPRKRPLPLPRGVTAVSMR